MARAKPLSQFPQATFVALIQRAMLSPVPLELPKDEAMRFRNLFYGFRAALAREEAAGRIGPISHVDAQAIIVQETDSPPGLLFSSREVSMLPASALSQLSALGIRPTATPPSAGSVPQLGPNNPLKVLTGSPPISDAGQALLDSLREAGIADPFNLDGGVANDKS